MFVGAVGLRHAIRAAGARGEGARLALRTLLGRAAPPFIEPPPVAVAPVAAELDGDLKRRREHDPLFV